MFAAQPSPAKPSQAKPEVVEKRKIRIWLNLVFSVEFFEIVQFDGGGGKR